MPRCYTCGEWIEEIEETGARCPRCRDALYEDPYDPHEVPEGRSSASGHCAVHGANPPRYDG